MSAIPRKDSAPGSLPGFSALPVAGDEAARLSDLHIRIQRLSRRLLEGGGLHAFLDEMEALVGEPAAIVREPDHIWLSAGLRSGEPDKERQQLLQALPTVVAGRKPGSGFVSLSGDRRAFACPIPNAGGKRAGLVLLERRVPLDRLDIAGAERLAPLVGLELANIEAVREVESKYLDRFLHDWLTGKIVTENDWKLRAEVCGCVLPERVKLCAALVGFSGPAPSAERLRELARTLRSERLRPVESLLAVPVGTDLVLIVPVPAAPAEPPAEDPAAAAIRRLPGELRPLVGDPGLRLFAGRPVERPEQLPGSLSQARRARQVSEVCGMEGDAVTYDRLGVYSLLYLIPPGEEREQFLQRFSLPLLKADRRGGGRLTETLEMYFRCNGNIKLTSERLFAHYNTVVYRLDKIQHILGVSLDDPEDRLQLQLSLKLGQIAPGTGDMNGSADK